MPPDDKAGRRSISPTPQGPEGPFYLPNQPIRSNIREDKDGLPFTITFRVKDCNNGGHPIANAEVHAWHADAVGVYSAYLGLYPLEKRERQPTAEVHEEPTDDSSFLRGVQPTNSNGEATFQTIFPGWYGSRTPHIHFKVFANNKNCYTGEVYFEDSLTDDIIAKGVKPYCDRDSSNKKTNDMDPLFGTHGGFKTVCKPVGDAAKSLSGTLDVIVDP